MNSIILKTITRLILAWMMIFSWWVLLRGHNAPGGGFIAGLIAAAAFSLYLLAYGLECLLDRIYFSPFAWLAAGLSLMLASSLFGACISSPVLSIVAFHSFKQWLNSAVLFDIGVYLVVCFSIVCMLIALERTL